MILEIFLSHLFKSIKTQKPLSGTTIIKLFQKSTWTHIHKNVNNYLENQRIIVIDHPFYSPDLGLSDFCLFGEKKRLISDKIYERSIRRVITETLAPIPKESAKKKFLS